MNTEIVGASRAALATLLKSISDHPGSVFHHDVVGGGLGGWVGGWTGGRGGSFT